MLVLFELLTDEVLGLFGRAYGALVLFELLTDEVLGLFERERAYGALVLFAYEGLALFDDETLKLIPDEAPLLFDLLFFDELFFFFFFFTFFGGPSKTLETSPAIASKASTISSKISSITDSSSPEYALALSSSEPRLLHPPFGLSSRSSLPPRTGIPFCRPASINFLCISSLRFSLAHNSLNFCCLASFAARAAIRASLNCFRSTVVTVLPPVGLDDLAGQAVDIANLPIVLYIGRRYSVQIGLRLLPFLLFVGGVRCLFQLTGSSARRLLRILTTKIVLNGFSSNFCLRKRLQSATEELICKYRT